jgi:hypothetical protein
VLVNNKCCPRFAKELFVEDVVNGEKGVYLAFYQVESHRENGMPNRVEK